MTSFSFSAFSSSTYSFCLKGCPFPLILFHLALFDQGVVFLSIFAFQETVFGEQLVLDAFPYFERLLILYGGYGPCLFQKVWHVYAEGFFHSHQSCQNRRRPGPGLMFLVQKLMLLSDLVERGSNRYVLLLLRIRHPGWAPTILS